MKPHVSTPDIAVKVLWDLVAVTQSTSEEKEGNEKEGRHKPNCKIPLFS